MPDCLPATCLTACRLSAACLPPTGLPAACLLHACCMPPAACLLQPPACRLPAAWSDWLIFRYRFDLPIVLVDTIGSQHFFTDESIIVSHKFWHNCIASSLEKKCISKFVYLYQRNSQIVANFMVSLVHNKNVMFFIALPKKICCVERTVLLYSIIRNRNKNMNMNICFSAYFAVQTWN